MPRKRGQVEAVDPFVSLVSSYEPPDKWPPKPDDVIRSVELQQMFVEQRGVGINQAQRIVRKMVDDGKIERFFATYMIDGKPLNTQWVRVLS